MRKLSTLVTSVGLVLLLPVPGWAEVAEFGAALTPSTVFAEVDSTVTVMFAVDETAKRFNAYEITIQFDPAVLAFVSAGEGSLMQTCPTFEFVAATDTSVTYTHSLLCAGVSLDGPGDLSGFTFQALAAGFSAATITTDSDWTFFDAGIRVSPDHPTFPRQVTFENALVVVGSAVDAPEVSGGVELEFFPNPTRAGGSFVLGAPRATGAAHLDVYDAGGRRVFHASWADAPTSPVRWRASEADGRSLPGGVYFARLKVGRLAKTEKIVLLR